MKTIGKCGGDTITLLPSAIFIIAPVWNTVLGKDDILLPYFYGIVTLFTVMYGIFHHHRPIAITRTDLLLGIWLLYTFFQTDWESLPVHIIIYCLATYLWGRQLAPPLSCRIFVYAGCIQVLLALLQLCNVIPSHHTYFQATGSFHNPGPLGGFLVLALMAAVASYHYIPHWKWRIYIVVLSVGLLLSDSRAAWVGALAGIGYYVMSRFFIRPLWRVLCVMATSIAFALLMAFCYKPASAQGRMVIWKVCIEIAKEHPFFGQGLASFSRNYMIQQTRYKEEKATNTEMRLMDNNKYAFNEFLCITCEQGIIGLLLFLALFITLWRTSSSSLLPIKTCLMAYVVFACFSYPLHIFFLQISLLMLCGCLANRSKVIYHCPTIKISILATVSILLIGGYFTLQGWYVLRAQQAVHRFLHNDDMQSLGYLETHLSTFVHEETILDSYALALCLKEEYERSIPILQQSIAWFPTTDKFIKLGNSYYSLKQYSQAETAYMEASRMLSNRLYPHYCLFMLYKETDQKEKAYHQAIQIQHLSPKKDNDYARELKSFIHDYLYNKKP